MALVVAKMEYAPGTTPASSDTTNNKHSKHTIVLVPLPHPKVRAVRPLTVFGYDDAPFGHAEVVLENVPLTQDHLIGGEGSGFKVSQARLGPGRIHHCMRAVGMSKFSKALFRGVRINEPIAHNCFHLFLPSVLRCIALIHP
jgi:acyl-CoA dehydrogenase